MLGCIARAGRHGIGRESSKLSRHLLQWVFEQGLDGERERTCCHTTNHRGQAMSMHTIPTPDEIDAVIFDMIAVEAAQVPTLAASLIFGRA
jgi:hypothetical protein